MGIRVIEKNSFGQYLRIYLGQVLTERFSFKPRVRPSQPPPVPRRLDMAVFHVQNGSDGLFPGCCIVSWSPRRILIVPLNWRTERTAVIAETETTTQPK